MSINLAIIIPTFNSWPYLSECIVSILNQKTDLKYRIVVICDGSTNKKELNFLKNINVIYENITIIYQENLGVSNARNAGIKKLLRLKDDCPEWFCFLDSDNFFSENAFNKIHKTIQNAKSDFFYCDLTILLQVTGFAR